MRGWILDLYAGEPGEMVVWLKDERGEAVRLVDRWSPSIYIAADERTDLGVPLKMVGDEFAWTRVVQKRERITDQAESEVLECKVKDARKVLRLASRIERLGPFGTYRLYNVDLPPNQSYLYERDLFPLAYCEVNGGGDRLEWDLQDDVMECNYRPPELKKLSVDVAIDKLGRIPKDTDGIKQIRLKNEIEELVIEGASEADNILELVRVVKALDPDFVTTSDGDAFLLPYLIRRAEANGVANRLTLDRDGTVLGLPRRKGTSFFSYGKICYRPSAVKLYGRIHVDTSTSFSYSEAGFHGLFELSRICRMPLQTASRASIGKALSSLQFYEAFKMDLLVPWKPTLAERFKDRAELLVADRGGFIFEPKMGLHEGVAELDFASLFPSIMLKKNISAETVGCSCCPDSTNRVPELGWNVCEKRKGLVPRSMKVIVEKRLKYKELKKTAAGEDYDRYDQCQAVLKWIGVTCLPKESPVFVIREGSERCVRIGDFVDSMAGKRTGVIQCPPDVFVAGVGPNYKAKYCRVANLIKKPNGQDLLSIEMEDGRKVVATPDHPFFILRGGELSVVEASRLEVGEAIPVARRISSLTRANDRVDLIENLGRQLSAEEQLLWRVSGEHLKEKILEKKKSLLKSAISEGYSYQAVIAWTKSGIIPLRFLRLLDLTPEIHSTLRIGVGKRLGGRIAWLPAVIEIDENLGFFLGLYVSDGSAVRTWVRLDIASSETELLETTKKLAKSLFGISAHIYKERKARMYVAQINSSSLVKILEKVFGLPGSAEKGKLKVPDIIFNCREGVARRFVAGLIAGDGHVSKERRFVDIATASKEFQKQIAFLAARLGLTYRLSTLRGGSNPMYTVNFIGPEAFGNIGSWEYFKENQKATIQSWSRESPDTCTHARYVRLPTAESGLFSLAKSTRTSSEPHVFDGSRTCPAQVKKKLERMSSRRLSEAQSEQVSNVARLLNGDLGFVRVRKITRLDACPEYVYCLQLAEGEVPGFFTGEGLVLAHNCFGYLGFNNAKFGRIDAHIAVCAWDRKILIDAARIAERRGYEVIHGIVDSLWLKREGADEADYLELKKEIEEETGFPLSFEGIYKWVAFLPSKVDAGLPVLNRYFGAYESGELKVRGIEARRHDTPPLFKRCQIEMLEILAQAGSVEEARGRVPMCVQVFLRYAEALRDHNVPAEELVFSVNLSKKPEEYANRTIQASAVRQLADEGVELHAGEGIRYVIRDYRSSGPRRVVPADFEGESGYDRGRYVELLAEACASVLQPFDGGCDAEMLRRRAETGAQETLPF